MNKANKYIWTLYFLIWVYFLFFDTSYEQGDHIFWYFIAGWIPFILASSLWAKNEETPNAQVTQDNTSLNDYELLLQIENKDRILKLIQLGKDAKILLKEQENRLQEFATRINKSIDDLEKNKIFFTLNIEDMKEYHEIIHTKNDFLIASNYVDGYANLLEDINNKLKEGLSLEIAKTMLDAGFRAINEERTKQRVNLITQEVISDELIKSIESVKTKNSNASYEELNKAKIDGTLIAKRVKKETERQFGFKLDEDIDKITKKEKGSSKKRVR